MQNNKVAERLKPLRSATRNAFQWYISATLAAIS